MHILLRRCGIVLCTPLADHIFRHSTASTTAAARFGHPHCLVCDLAQRQVSVQFSQRQAFDTPAHFAEPSVQACHTNRFCHFSTQHCSWYRSGLRMCRNFGVAAHSRDHRLPMGIRSYRVQACNADSIAILLSTKLTTTSPSQDNIVQHRYLRWPSHAWGTHRMVQIPTQSVHFPFIEDFLVRAGHARTRSNLFARGRGVQDFVQVHMDDASGQGIGRMPCPQALGAKA